MHRRLFWPLCGREFDVPSPPAIDLSGHAYPKPHARGSCSEQVISCHLSMTKFSVHFTDFDGLESGDSYLRDCVLWRMRVPSRVLASAPPPRCVRGRTASRRATRGTYSSRCVRTLSLGSQPHCASLVGLLRLFASGFALLQVYASRQYCTKSTHILNVAVPVLTQFIADRPTQVAWFQYHKSGMRLSAEHTQRPGETLSGALFTC